MSNKKETNLLEQHSSFIPPRHAPVSDRLEQYRKRYAIIREKIQQASLTFDTARRALADHQLPDAINTLSVLPTAFLVAADELGELLDAYGDEANQEAYLHNKRWYLILWSWQDSTDWRFYYPIGPFATEAEANAVRDEAQRLPGSHIYPGRHEIGQRVLMLDGAREESIVRYLKLGPCLGTTVPLTLDDFMERAGRSAEQERLARENHITAMKRAQMERQDWSTTGLRWKGWK